MGIEAKLSEFIKDNIVAEIMYKDSKGSVSTREVEPYEIKDGSMYAYCLSKNALRKFKLSNILLVKTRGEKFIPRY